MSSPDWGRTTATYYNFLEKFKNADYPEHARVALKNGGCSGAKSPKKADDPNMLNIKSRTLRLVVIAQLTVLFLFVAMTIFNEIFDLPHILFGDKPTSIDQRLGEVFIELAILTIIILVEAFLIRKLYKRIIILEGFLPICANCKKIRHEGSWDQIEEYISGHSLAKFSHTICPDCIKKLYPELGNKVKED